MSHVELTNQDLLVHFFGGGEFVTTGTHSSCRVCDMTHSCVCHDSFLCVIWHSCERKGNFERTHLHVWHDSFICVTWLIYVCDMTYLYVWHDSFICVTWLSGEREGNFERLWQKSKSFAGRMLQWLRYSCVVFMWITHKSIWINKSSANPKSTSNQSSKPCTVLQYPSRKDCGIHVWDLTHMGWLRLVGCLKIQVSLQDTGLFCRALLQKRPIFLSILLIIATP